MNEEAAVTLLGRNVNPNLHELDYMSSYREVEFGSPETSMILIRWYGEVEYEAHRDDGKASMHKRDCLPN